MTSPYTSQSHIVQTVRTQDKDRFLLGLMTPTKHREALWALFAFNYEIAKTREVVSETTIGLIRLQWWRDAIKEIYEGNKIREHYVVTALAKAIKTYDLPRDLFDNLIYAREFDLEGVAPANKTGLLNYCDFTNTPLNQLTLKVIDQEEGLETITQISKNYGLIGIIRSLLNMLSQRRVYISNDILKAYDLNEASLVDYDPREKLPMIIKDMMALLNFDKTPQSKYLKRVHKMTQLYAKQIEALNYDVFDPRMAIPPKFMALRLTLLLT